jgi:hypothetical protein
MIRRAVANWRRRIAVVDLQAGPASSVAVLSHLAPTLPHGAQIPALYVVDSVPVSYTSRIEREHGAGTRMNARCPAHDHFNSPATPGLGQAVHHRRGADLGDLG